MMREALFVSLLWPAIAWGQESPPKPDEKQAKILCAAKTAKLHTGGVFYDSPAGHPFERMAVDLLVSRGVTMVPDRPDVLFRLDRLLTTNSTVRLNVERMAVTSTTIRGRISLEAPGVKPYRVSFRGKQYGPWAMSSYNRYRKGKVVGDAFQDGYAKTLKHLFDFCHVR